MLNDAAVFQCTNVLNQSVGLAGAFDHAQGHCMPHISRQLHVCHAPLHMTLLGFLEAWVGWRVSSQLQFTPSGNCACSWTKRLVSNIAGSVYWVLAGISEDKFIIPSLSLPCNLPDFAGDCFRIPTCHLQAGARLPCEQF